MEVRAFSGSLLDMVAVANLQARRSRSQIATEVTLMATATVLHGLAIDYTHCFARDLPKSSVCDSTAISLAAKVPAPLKKAYRGAKLYLFYS